MDTDDLMRRLEPIAEVAAKSGLYSCLWQDVNGCICWRRQSCDG
jgi:hypothetical protein